MLKCKNPECLKTFPIAARISEEQGTPPSFAIGKPTRKIVEKACCPYCESPDIEEVK